MPETNQGETLVQVFSLDLFSSNHSYLFSGQPNVESSIVKSGPAGYYYQGVWHALGGSAGHQFNNEAITRCLRGKVVYMFGDSTVRQFFEYLNTGLASR